MNSQQSFFIGSDNQPPVVDRHTVHLDAGYLAQFDQIKPEEYARTGLISVVDDSMAPQLIPDSALLVVLLGQADYRTATGVVAVTLRSKPNRYFIRRVFATDRKAIHLSRDNAAWPALTVKWADIASLCEIRYIIDKPAK